MTGTDSSPQNVTGIRIFSCCPAAPPLADGVASAKPPFPAPCKRLFAVTHEFRASIFLCVLWNYTLFIQKCQGGFCFYVKINFEKYAPQKCLAFGVHIKSGRFYSFFSERASSLSLVTFTKLPWSFSRIV